tara:strand:- start:505 stop:636 length:132 start_codon:yes stop_codon:yes gene_type:complete
VVAGRSHRANIEQYEMRWFIGKEMDNFDQLRNYWFGYMRIVKK